MSHLHIHMPESSRLRIAIAGAGIAGLTAAIALQKHPGIEVQIYEGASELQEIGASIALGPNGMKALDRLGIENALSDEIAFKNLRTRQPHIYRLVHNSLSRVTLVVNEAQPLENERGRLSRQAANTPYSQAPYRTILPGSFAPSASSSYSLK